MKNLNLEVKAIIRPQNQSVFSLKTHHVYFTLKRRRFHVVSTQNTRGVFVGLPLLSKVL